MHYINNNKKVQNIIKLFSKITIFITRIPLNAQIKSVINFFFFLLITKKLIFHG